MSDRRYTAIFGAAVLTAGVATFSVYRMLRAAAEPSREPMRPVVLVAEDVPAGVAVPREALSQVLWPARVAPAEAFASVDSVAGRVTREALAKGEPVRATALAAHGAAPGLEGTIAPDRRAIAVRVNEAAGVSGLVRPNSRVDVLVTSRGDNLGTTARVVMADVRVLGVGPARPPEVKDNDPKEPMPANVASIITLEVTPLQAALVAAAEQQGTIQVVLRGFGSRSAADTIAPLAAVSVTQDGPGGALVSGVPGGAFPGGMPAGMPGVAGGRLGFGARPSGAAPAQLAPQPAPVRRVTHAAPRPAAVTVAAPAAPPRPDSVTIHVYKGGQMTTVRVEATTQPAAAAPAAAPALRTAALGQP